MSNSAGGAATDGVLFESILTTEELKARPSRAPDYEAENRALLAVVQHMADSPRTTLQALVEVALDICRAGSAGVSFVDEKTGNFYWPAIAGQWRPHIGGGTPRDFGPCGVVLDRDAVQLFSYPERYYPYLRPAGPIVEALLIPFHVAGKAVGTVWVIAHDENRKFDEEDERLIQSLGRLAAAFHPFWAALQAQDQQGQSLRDVNEGLLISSIRQHELTEQAEKAEAALRVSEDRLASELAATQRLQQTSTQLIHEDNDVLLHEQILDAAASIMQSDMASIQVLDETGNALRLLTSRGFDEEFGKAFTLIYPDQRTSFSVAWREGHRVVVSDVETCDFLAGTHELADHRQSGIRATQSTPLVSRGGRLLGMLSTHWRKPCQPLESNLRLLDVLARQASDLLERSQGDKSLRESEERYRMLVSVITDVPWTAGRYGEFIAPQLTWAVYTGQTWDEMRGIGWLNAFHPDDRAKVEKLWMAACQERTLFESVGRLWHAATRQYRAFEARATPVLNADGNVREWVGTCTDVEERKRFETALQNLNSDLKHFSYAASHDLQEPLRMVRMAAQVLERKYKGKLDAEADQFIGYALAGAEQMDILLHGLRDYWSVNEQKIEELVPISCDHVLEMALANLDVSVKESGAVITHDVLPWIISAELPLTLLLQNLIGNAIKYRRPETAPRVHLSVRRDGDNWKISVADNGVGIQAEYLKQIFEPFKRLHTREFPGSGLGLAICQKTVDRYGGRIWAESDNDEGSTFYITIPARCAEQPVNRELTVNA